MCGTRASFRSGYQAYGRVVRQHAGETMTWAHGADGGRAWARKSRSPKNNAACCFAIYQTVCMSGNRYFSRIVGVVSLCKRDPSDFFLITRVDKDFKKTLFVQVWVLRLPHTMMSACSRLTALPAQFARGRTASLTARTAKFTAQVRQHNVHGPLLFFPSPRRGNFPRHARRHRRSQLVVL